MPAHAKDIYQRRLNPRDLLHRKLNAVTFVVTCTEANVEALRALAANPHRVHGYGLRDIIGLSPPLPQSELVQCYNQSRLFVLSCIILVNGNRDGIHNFMAEAMACALPVVVTGIFGIPELVDDEKTGLIVAQRDSVALSNAIARVLGDDALARRMRAAARHRVEKRFNAVNTHVVLEHLFYSQIYSTEGSAAWWIKESVQPTLLSH